MTERATESNPRFTPDRPPTEQSAKSLPRCLDCNYALIGLSENRCPECGRAFDPNDPRTWRASRRFPAHSRWLIKPTGRLFFLFVFGVCLLMLYADIPPGGYAMFMTGSIIAGFFLALFWLVRLIVCVAASVYYRPVPSSRRDIFRWLVPPLVAVFTVFLVSLNVPLFIAYRLSRPAMDRFARQILNDEIAVPKSCRVGAYQVIHVEKDADCVHFIVSGTGLLDECGFEYYPQIPPSKRPRPQYPALSDGWFIWEN